MCISDGVRRCGVGKSVGIFGCGAFGPVAPLATAGNSHLLAVLGDGASSDVQSVPLKGGHDLIVAQRVLFIFFIDDFLELDSDGIPRHVFAIVGARASDEESLEWIDAARSLDPLVIDRSTDRGHMDMDRIGNLLHLQRLDRFRSLF